MNVYEIKDNHGLTYYVVAKDVPEASSVKLPFGNIVRGVHELGEVLNSEK